MNSKPIPTKRHYIILSLLAILLFLLPMAEIHGQGDPTLRIQTDPTGLKITWDRVLGADHILEASDDLATWTQVKLSVVREGSLHRVFVPITLANKFYRLTKDGERIHAAYVGSLACRTCHRSHYEDFMNTGHPYKLVKVQGQAPSYPHSTVPQPPDGYTWNDISWVIGGAIYKTRFIDRNGFIITGQNVQWNLETKRWVAYNTQDPVGTKKYDCGSCHTTGWNPVSSGGVRQDGLPGMDGSFAAAGIQCEACHGPGSRHVSAPSKVNITLDRSVTLCGSCHVRGNPESIPASGGFVRHHESYNELLASPHKGLSCNDCHNPHRSVKHDQTGGIKKSCTECHSPAVYDTHSHRDVAQCSDCHMPLAVKTAENSNKYTADISSHIFKINTDPAAPLFTGGTADASKGLPLGYVCYRCHQDPDGIGGGELTLTADQMGAKARGFHR